ncbi:substrate-binding domain-containing protein [Streptomyces seoulensis]|nr:substrate-binding domain-containing protein [Streptomyces seoulensis]
MVLLTGSGRSNGGHLAAVRTLQRCKERGEESARAVRRAVASNLIGVLVPRLPVSGTSPTNSATGPTHWPRDCAPAALVIGDAHLDGAALDLPALRNTPFVLVNRRTNAGHASVTCDDRLGGRLVAEHLLALGHRSVGVIAGRPFASTGTDRTEGFVERYREAGLPLPERRVVHSAFDTAGGHEAARALLAAPEDRPTALFAVNDFAAIGAAGAARDLGLTLGRDLALAGFADTALAAQLPLPLTSVHSPMAEERVGRRRRWAMPWSRAASRWVRLPVER